MTDEAADTTLPGLYLHVPFCSAICPYCDFAVLTAAPERRRRFVDTLLREAELWAGDAPGPMDTVYLGGGTPSILEPEDLERLLAGIRQRLPLAADPWIFLEANPEDVTRESVAAWRRLGVGTLSLGVQSFDDAALRFLGRRHDGTGARRAVRIAQEAGFHTLSLDLIYGLPDQTAPAWRRELETALALGPQHLSCYQLTIHRGTPFGFRRRRGERLVLTEEGQADLFLLAHEHLEARGLPGYEVSNFASSPEHRSRHNRKYWRHLPYLGLGPSAHSFDGRNRRWWSHPKLGAWEAAVEAGERPVAGTETLGTEELVLEALMLGFRTRDGVDLEALGRRRGVDLLGLNRSWLAELTARDLVLRDGLDGSRLTPTLRGLAVADGLAAGFRLRSSGGA